MKISGFAYLFLFMFSCGFMTSCGNATPTPVNPSSDATIKSFKLNNRIDTKDTILVSSAAFTIDDTKETIYNVDSLPYGTKIDSLQPTISFTSSYGYIINDTLTYNSYSTAPFLKFTKPVKITNVATDTKTKKNYTIEVRVHKVEAYLLTWTKAKNQISADVSGNQKAVLFKKNIHFYTYSGGNISLYTSSDGVSWTQQTVSGLPADVSFQNMDTFNITKDWDKNQIYLAHNNVIYTSADGENWNIKSTAAQFAFKALLGEYQSKLYAISLNTATNKYSIVNSADGQNWTEAYPMPANFPVRDFATTAFQPKYGLPKIQVVGGYDANNNKLNTRWSTENGTYWLNLDDSKTATFAPVSNAALTYYGSRLLLIGGSNALENLVDSVPQFCNSLDEGRTWAKPNKKQISFPADKSYAFRSHASVIFNPFDKYLYIIGGKSSTAPLSDVWKLKVNYYSFEDWYKY